MADGTREEYAFIQKCEEGRDAGLADTVLEMLVGLGGETFGYKVDRLTHSLQSGTLAMRDGADEEQIVCALLHDIGDNFAPHNHGQFAAAILRPYVSEENYWVVAHHGLFQGYYYFHHYGGDRRRAGSVQGPPVLRCVRAILRALGSERIRSGLRYAAARDLRAHGAAAVCRAAAEVRLTLSWSAVGASLLANETRFASAQHLHCQTMLLNLGVCLPVRSAASAGK